MPPQAPQYTQNVKEQFPSATLKVGWPKRLIIFALLVFVSVALIYIGLAFGYKVFLNSKIGDLGEGLESLSSQISEEAKDDLSRLYSQVTNMRSLLRDHVLSSRVFTLLESLTSPNVTFIDLDLSAEEREITISGVAASYEDLVAQLALLEGSSYVERYNLGSSEWDAGLITFDLSITMVEEAFLPER